MFQVDIPDIPDEPTKDSIAEIAKFSAYLHINFITNVPQWQVKVEKKSESKKKSERMYCTIKIFIVFFMNFLSKRKRRKKNDENIKKFLSPASFHFSLPTNQTYFFPTNWEKNFERWKKYINPQKFCFIFYMQEFFIFFAWKEKKNHSFKYNQKIK